MPIKQKALLPRSVQQFGSCFNLMPTHDHLCGIRFFYIHSKSFLFFFCFYQGSENPQRSKKTTGDKLLCAVCMNVGDVFLKQPFELL